MRLASEVKEPQQNYFLLLRALFRSIGGTSLDTCSLSDGLSPIQGGKFEILYREFLPLLPLLLEG